MNKSIVLILGGNGFVGSHIADVFWQDKKIKTLSTSRNPTHQQIFFDILDPSSWSSILEIKPDYIIDATGYGVIKEQTNLDLLYKINYIQKTDFLNYVYSHLPNTFWIQIGTAFEYSLELEQLTETSLCFPKTHYGISKALFSSYLTQKIKQQHCIIRPFGMLGEAEDASKFFPMLVLSQKEKRVIKLSDGSQKRDYFYVKDLGRFIHLLIETKRLVELDGHIVNVGSGVAASLRELSQKLAEQIPNFDPIYWNWGSIPQREGEYSIFYNASLKAFDLGLTISPLEKVFQKTVAFYYQHGTNTISI